MSPELTRVTAEFGSHMLVIGILVGFFLGLSMRWGDDFAAWVTPFILRRLRRRGPADV